MPLVSIPQKTSRRKWWLWLPLAFVVFFVVSLGGLFLLERYIYKTPFPVVSSPKQTETPGASQVVERKEVNFNDSISPATPLRLERMKAVGFGISAGAELTHINPKELDAYIKDMQALGVKWARLDIDWETIQAEGSQNYDWAPVDRAIQSLRRAGIEPIADLTFAPVWSAPRQDKNPNFHYPPKDPASFAKFAGQVTERYKKDIHYYEIWNEPNFRGFWYPNPNIQDYAVLLKLTSVEIHKMDPDAVVLSGGLAPVGNEGSDGVGTVKFIKGLYDLGANKYFDAVALHPYTFPSSPSSQDEWNNWNMIKNIYEIMAAKGDGTKKIWITEFGVPTGGSGIARELNDFGYQFDHDFMTEGAQQIIAAESASAVIQNRQLFGPFFWYNMYDRKEENPVPEHRFGLMRPDGSRKPAYETLREAFKDFK